MKTKAKTINKNIEKNVEQIENKESNKVTNEKGKPKSKETKKIKQIEGKQKIENKKEISTEKQQEVKIEEKETKVENTKDENNQKKKTPILKKILITLITLMIIGATTILILFYGPISTFRDWWITTAMTTMSHKYLAEWFFDDETINQVLDKNRIEETDETTDTSLIVIMPNEQEKEEPEEKIEYANEYEKQLLAENLDKEKYNIYAEGEDYRIIKIKGNGYSGYLAAIYDPSKVKVATSKYIGRAGQYLTDMSKDNNAVISINGGGFLDENSKGNGSTPLGIVISNGKVIANNGNTVGGGLIGFDKENKLVIGKMSVEKAKSIGIRDAVTFAPFLIVNGEPVKIRGNGGWGSAPRTVIGQRQDGIVLFLVLDGRRLTMPGATIKDLIEIMQNYGAYNAANLDGGTSSAMTYNHELVNDPVDASGNHRTRQIATSFIFTNDE